MKVAKLKEKIRESRLRWYGHVKRKEEDEFVRWSAERRETGTRKRRRPKKRWMDCVRDDGKVVDLSRVGDRRQWRAVSRRPNPLEGTNGMMIRCPCPLNRGFIYTIYQGLNSGL